MPVDLSLIRRVVLDSMCKYMDLTCTCGKDNISYEECIESHTENTLRIKKVIASGEVSLTPMETDQNE